MLLAVEDRLGIWIWKDMNAIWQKLRGKSQDSAAQVIGAHPPWKAKSVWAAFALALLGGGLWVNDSLKRQEAPADSPPGVTRLAESPDVGGQEQTKVKARPPATLRIGASYVGGFFLGWAFRRFVKATLLVSATAITLLFMAKKLGWFDVDWNSAETHVQHGLTWIQEEAAALKKFLTGYLPSAGAAAVGVFLGFRRK